MASTALRAKDGELAALTQQATEARHRADAEERRARTAELEASARERRASDTLAELRHDLLAGLQEALARNNRELREEVLQAQRAT